MKVTLVPMDGNGCGSYRLLYPMRVLQGQGYDVGVRGTDLAPHFRGVVVLQRPTEREVAIESIPKLQGKGFAVVIEVDDNLGALHPQHVVYRRLHPRYSPNDNHSWLDAACEHADLVTVSTPALAEKYAPHGRYAVLPNLLRAGDIAPGPSTGTRFTWAGQPATHPTDAKVAARAAHALISEGWGLDVFDQDAADELGARPSQYNVLPWRPLDTYVQSLREFGLGLVPLRESTFNEGKSWLKGLEYAGAGVPFIATPTSSYRELANLGAGVLAGSEKEWRKRALELARDEDARLRLAESGLRAARSLTYEEHAHRWWDAWKLAREYYEGRDLSVQAEWWAERKAPSVVF